MRQFSDFFHSFLSSDFSNYIICKIVKKQSLLKSYGFVKYHKVSALSKYVISRDGVNSEVTKGLIFPYFIKLFPPRSNKLLTKMTFITWNSAREFNLGVSHLI